MCDWQAEDPMDVSTDGADSDEEDDDFVQTDSDAEAAGTSRDGRSKSLPSGGGKRGSTRPRRAASNSIVVDLTSDSSEDEIRSPVRRRPPSSVKPAAGKPQLVTVKPDPESVKTEAPAAAQTEPMQVSLMSYAHMAWSSSVLHALDEIGTCDCCL